MACCSPRLISAAMAACRDRRPAGVCVVFESLRVHEALLFEGLGFPLGQCSVSIKS